MPSLALYLSYLFQSCLCVHYYIFCQICLWVHSTCPLSGVHSLSPCIPEIVFCRCGGGHYRSFCSGHDVSSLHYPDLVASPTVVFWFMSSYCYMHPWFPIFSLHCCSWSCRQKIITWVSVSLIGATYFLEQQGYFHCCHILWVVC